MRGTKIQILSLIAIAAIALLIHFFFFHGGYFGYDELEYTNLAVKLLRGEYEHSLNLYAFRWAVILPLTFFYALFGIGDFANMLPTLISLLLILYITLDLMKEYSFAAKLIGVCLVVCTPIHLMYLAKPMPDVIVELGFLLCFAAYYKTSFSTSKSFRPAIAMFTAGVLLFFLAKETFLVFYPFFLVLLAVDIKKGQRWGFWKGAIISTFVFLAFYLGFFWVKAGNPFVRIDSLFHERYISECTYELQPAAVLIKRVLYGLWLDFMKFGVLIPVGFILLLFKKHSLKPTEKFIIASYLGTLLLSNFMTISYSSYVPLCDDSRHFLFVIPFAAMTAIIGFSHLKELGITERIIIALTILLQWYLTSSLFLENYTFIFLPIIPAILFWKKLNATWPWVLLVISGISYQYISNASYHKRLNFPDQKKLIEYVLEQPNLKIIVTDPANVRIGMFYANYPPGKDLFINYERYGKMKLPPNESIYFISNGITAYHSNINWDLVPDDILHAPEQKEPIMENPAGAVYLLTE